MKALFSVVLFLLSQVVSAAPLRIALVSEGESTRGWSAVSQLQSELDKLLDEGGAVLTPVALSSLSTDAMIERLYAESDVVVAWGLMASSTLGMRLPLSKPTLLSLVPQPDLLGLEPQADGGSGVPNLVYIHAQRDLADELDTFHQLFGFSHVALLVSERMQARPEMARRLAELSRSQRFETSLLWIPEGATDPPELPEGVDAVLVGPLGPDLSAPRLAPWIEVWSARGLPTYTTLGRQFSDLQAAAGTALGFSRQTMLRRIALDISKIAQGTRPETLAVELVDLHPQLVLNMAVLRQIRHFPPWSMMSEASLVQVETQLGARRLDLRQAIALALQRNLALQAQRIAARSTEHDVGIARGALLPQLSVSTGIEGIDSATSAATRGARSPVTWAGQVGFSQAIVAEPLWASLSIQKLSAETRRLTTNQSELDTVLAAAEAYLGVLRTQAMTRIENRNVETTRQNLRIAQRRLDAGALARTDVARWESQLALDRATLNDVLATLQASRYRLNQLLDQPQAEPVELVDLQSTDVASLLADQELGRFIDDPVALERFADFLLVVALNKLPELEQLRLSIEAQQRLFQSRRRALYLPRMMLSGQASQAFYRYGEVELPAGVSPVTPANTPSWVLGLGLSLPLYEGGAQRHREQKTALEIKRLERQREELETQLELRLRSQLQHVGAAFARIGLARVATAAAEESLSSAQRAYAEGQVPVSQLIDAQQGALQAELSAASAEYQYILEFLRAERAVGGFFFLMDRDEQRATVGRARDFFGGAK